jgi:hypothetical protein
MTTKDTTVFSLEAARLRDNVRVKRDALRRNYDRIRELEIEAMEQRIEQLDRDHATAMKHQRDREKARTENEQRNRAELEARLMREYRESSPGTTETEAKAALPDLLHRHRLAEQDKLDAARAEARRRLRF